MKASEEARILAPYLLPYLQRMVNNGNGNGNGNAGIGGAPSPHALSSTHHSGTLANSQGPQFLLVDGTRELQGHWQVATGITIDSVDIDVFKAAYDAHVANPDAHHLRVAAGDGILVNVPLQSVAVNEAFNFDWTGSHTFSVGTVTFNTTPQVNANLNFVGLDRVITANDDLYLQPSSDLWLDPAGLIMLPDSQELRSATIADLPTGIQGIRLWERSDAINYWQLTMGAAKFDELYARVFVADETRIDRGEEYWSKSYGIVETDFVLPAIGATVDVWFEDAPALLGANLFSVNDWLLLRVIDWGTGILILKCWLQVQSLVTLDGANDRQQWRLVRKKFGTTGVTIKKGNTILDSGQPGQGWLHLSALEQDGGPFFQVGEFTQVIADEPQFEPRTRLGSLNGTVDYATDAWGLVAGNHIGTQPDAGFSGFTVDGTNGLRLFNTDLEIYDAGNKVIEISEATGINLIFDDNLQDTDYTAITWYNNLAAPGSQYAKITAYEDVGVNLLLEANGVGDPAYVALIATGILGQGTIVARHDSVSMGMGGNVLSLFYNQRARFNDNVRFIDNSTAINENTGITIEQEGTGDAALHWRVTGTDTYYTAGIDNSDGDKFKISAATSLGATDFLIYNPTTGEVTINGLGTGGTPPSGLVAGDGINLAGSTISVNASVVRTSRNVTAGDGLDGGGTLGTDISLAVDSSVVRTSRQILAGAGLSGGGDLTANRTLAISLQTPSGLVTAGGLAIADTIAGDGLDIASKILAVDSTVVRTTRVVGTGFGLQGGGSLAADMSLSIKLPIPSGLMVSAAGLSVDDAIAGDGLDIAGKILAVDATVVRTSRTVSTSGALAGGGDLSTNRALSIVLDVPSGLTQGAGLAVADSIAGDGLDIIDKIMKVDSTVVRTSRLVATAGALAGGGDLSMDRALTLTLASPSGLNQTAGLALDDSVAGDGLGMSAKILSIGQGVGLTVGPSTVSVDLAYDFNWIGTHTFTEDPQLIANLDFIGTRQITTDGTNNIELVPGGDVVLNPASQDVLPGGSGLVDFGDYNRRFRTIYATELAVGNIVAQDVMATVGGRVLVGPTTSLVRAVTALDTTIDVVHNQLANGDYVWLESSAGGVPNVEVMQIISAPTVIAEGFRYTVTRNVDGSGINTWAVGDAVFNIGGVVGEGWIDLAASQTVMSHYGPTVTIYSRTSTAAWNNALPVVSMGNLESFVDYGATEFGFAAGNDLTLSPAGGYSGFTADRTDGLRLFNTDLDIYEAGDPVLLLRRDVGLALELDQDRNIYWYEDLDLIGTATPLAEIKMVSTGVSLPQLEMNISKPGGSSSLMLQAGDLGVSGSATTLTLNNDGFTFANLAGTPIIGSSAASIYIQNSLNVYSNLRVGDTVAARGVLDVNGDVGANSWMYLAGNAQGTNPDATANYGLSIGWNPSTGEGESQILFGTGSGSGPRLDFGSWNGTTKAIFVTMRNNRLGVGTNNPLNSFHVSSPNGIRHTNNQSVIAGGAIMQGILDGSQYDRAWFGTNALYSTVAGGWTIDAIGANDATGMVILNGGDIYWISHLSTGNTSRFLTHAQFISNPIAVLDRWGNYSVDGQLSTASNLVVSGNATIVGDVITAGLDFGDGAIMRQFDAGTWQPQFLGATSNPTITYFIREGYWQQVGTFVSCQAHVEITSVSVAGSGTLYVNLPITAPAVPYRQIGTATGVVGGNSFYGHIRALGNSTTANFTGSLSLLSASSLQAGDYITMAINYYSG